MRTIQQTDKTRIPCTHDKLSLESSAENKVAQFLLAEKQWSNWIAKDFVTLFPLQISWAVAVATVMPKRLNANLKRKRKSTS